jgi:hypothetical protein
MMSRSRRFIVSIVALVLPFGEIAAQPDSRDALLQQRQQLLNERTHLEAERNQERRRVMHYLTLLDEIIVIRRVLARWGTEDPLQWLMATRGQLYYNSFKVEEWAALIQDHRTWARQYFALVDQAVRTSGTWPPDRPPLQWRALAEQELVGVRQRYEQQMTQSANPVAELMRANQILAWTNGVVGMTPVLDHFGGTSQRVAAAMAWTPQ